MMRAMPHSASVRGVAALVLAAALLPGPALADDPPAGGAAIDYKAAREQAIHYYRQNKALWARSAELLKKAAATPDGAKDWKTVYWLAKITNENNILEDAFPAARQSLELAGKEEQKQKSSALVQYLEKSFGGVTFTQDERQARTLQEGYIILDVDKPLINQQKKAVFTAIKDRFAQTTVKLPKTLYLPFGDYRANGAPFKIEKDTEAKAVLFLFAEPGGAEGMSWPWIVGIGGGAAALVAGVGALILVTDDRLHMKVDTVITAK